MLDYRRINHEIGYVRGNIHCNGVQNFWALLQRTLGGTYVSVEPFHPAAYVADVPFQPAPDNDAGRFLKALAMVPTKRLTYKDLTHAEPLS